MALRDMEPGVVKNTQHLLERRHGTPPPKEVAAAIADAKRASNGFIKHLGEKVNKETGKWEYHPARDFVKAANDDSRAKDHAFEHGVYVRRIVIGEVCNIPELQTPKALDVAVEAAIFAGRTHDLVQVFDIHRKLNGAEVEDPKFGHELGAAALFMSLPRLYAQTKKGLGKPSKDDYAHAERVMFAATAMVMNHERHDVFRNQIAAQEKAYELVQDDTERRPHNHYTKKPKPITDEFLAKFENGDIDVYSLSRAQIMDLFRLKREKGGYLSAESIYGFPPELEAVYAQEFKQAAEETRPLEDFFDFGGNDNRVDYNLAAEAFMRADIRAMFAPWDATFSRTLLVARSRTRQYFPQVIEDEDRVFSHIRDSKGHFDNDAQRMLWELMQDTHPNSAIAKNEQYALDANRMKLAKAYAVLMLGEHILYGEYDKAMDPIYMRRIARVAEKALGHIIKDESILNEIGESFVPKPGQTIEEYQDKVVGYVIFRAQQEQPQLIDAFTQVVSDLVEERNTLVNEILPHKPDNSRHTVRPIDGSDRPDVASFKRIVNRVIETLSEGLSDEQRHECKTAVQEGRGLPSPFGKSSVDSLRRYTPDTWDVENESTVA